MKNGNFTRRWVSYKTLMRCLINDIDLEFVGWVVPEKKVYLLILIACCFYSCKTVLCSNDVQYQLFKGNTSVYPNTDSVAVGDTIFFRSEIPEKLKWVMVNGDSVAEDFSNATDMSTNLNVKQLIGNNQSLGAADFFDFIPIKGTIDAVPINVSIGKVINYAEIDGVYICSFGLVPKKKGIYLIQILDIFKATKKCVNASIEIVYSEKDQHLQYLKDIYYDGLPLNITDSTHSYCLKVTD